MNNIQTIKFHGRKRKARILSEEEIIPDDAYFSIDDGKTWMKSLASGDTVKEHQGVIERIYMVLVK